jgi:DNA-binding NtrC family response regulator
VTDQATVPHRITGVPLRTLRVEVVEGPDRGRSFSAQSDLVTIGSAPGNDLVLADDTVSRYHLELRRREDRILLRDLDSTNGTEFGGVLLNQASVLPGIKLRVGKTVITVADGETLTVELHDEDNLGELRGRSPEMRALMAQVRRVARTDASVLLMGETGTGKEVFARAVHECSSRSEQAFETVDCGSLLPTLIASELFGHEKGAFTGAERQHIGAFERAHGGTIFLDEIGELPSSLQPVLLGALERRQFRRVGGTKPIPVDVRLVAATNRDLRQEVNSGAFRADLYYRMAVTLFRLPSLRERPQDIPLLVEHFALQAGFDGEVDGFISPAVMQSLKQHHWPGNVRELRNYVEAALAMGEPPRLGESDPVAPSSGPTSSFPSVPVEALAERPYKDARSTVLDEFERIYLARLLERAGGNVSNAARIARMNRSYLIQMLKRHGIR